MHDLFGGGGGRWSCALAGWLDGLAGKWAEDRVVFSDKAAVEGPEGQPGWLEWSGGGEAGLEVDACLKSIRVKEVVARWPESSCSLGCPAIGNKKQQSFRDTN